MMLLLAGSSCFGAALGIWLGVRLGAAVLGSRLALGLAATVTLGGVLAGFPPVVTAPWLGLSSGLFVVTMWWAAMAGSKRRLAGSFSVVIKREIVWHELMGVIWVVFVVASVLAAAAALVAGSWPGALVVLAAAIVAGLYGGGSTADDIESRSLADFAADLVETPDSEDRARLSGALSSGGVSLIPWPPVMFRGLVGWNLGLGLDSEHAAWAAQLARSYGLGDMLSEPATVADDEQAAVVATCRAIAGHGDVVVEVASDQPQSVLRRTAQIVADHRGERRVVVVTDDPSAGRAFMARSC